MGTHLGGAQSTQNKSGHSEEDSIWTPVCVDHSPLWALRTQSSDHSTLEHGCTMGHDRSTTRHPLHQTHATTGTAWLETSSHLSTCGCHPWPWTHSKHLLCWLLSLKLPLFVYNLHVTLLAYWGVSPNKPDIVERDKCEWLLLGMLLCSRQCLSAFHLYNWDFPLNFQSLTCSLLTQLNKGGVELILSTLLNEKPSWSLPCPESYCTGMNVQ